MKGINVFLCLVFTVMSFVGIFAVFDPKYSNSPLSWIVFGVGIVGLILITIFFTKERIPYQKN